MIILNYLQALTNGWAGVQTDIDPMLRQQQQALANRLAAQVSIY